MSTFKDADHNKSIKLSLALIKKNINIAYIIVSMTKKITFLKSWINQTFHKCFSNTNKFKEESEKKKLTKFIEKIKHRNKVQSISLKWNLNIS